MRLLTTPENREGDMIYSYLIIKKAGLRAIVKLLRPQVDYLIGGSSLVVECCIQYLSNICGFMCRLISFIDVLVPADTHVDYRTDG